MSLRSFTVFQDVPSQEHTQPRHTSRITRSSTLNTLANALDKENVHPVTGERAGPIAATKKRKTNVLATKVYVPSKHETKGSQPEHKKRKPSTKAKTGAKKESKGTGSSKKGPVKRSSRRVSPLPKVDEEVDAEHHSDPITQATIDSRCYELTVKPLADVSKAYEQESPFVDLTPDDNTKLRFIKDSSAEPEISDYFSLSQSLTARLRTPSEEPHEGRAFSTPERKQIYAAFTFSSPSPTSERFRLSRSRSPSPHTDLA